MQLSHIPQCSIQNRNVHISVLNGALWDMEQLHSGICESCQLRTVRLNCTSARSTFGIVFLIGIYVLHNIEKTISQMCVDFLIVSIGSQLSLISYGFPDGYLHQCWNTVNLTVGTNLSDIVIEIQTLSFKKMRLKVPSAKWRPFCLVFNVSTVWTSWFITGSGHGFLPVPEKQFSVEFELRY